MDKGKEGEFFTSLMEVAKEIILDTKKLVSIITSTEQSIEEEDIDVTVMEQSEETEQRTVKLVDFIVRL